MQDAQQATDTQTAAAARGATLEPSSPVAGLEADGASGEVPPQNILASLLLVAGLALACFILLRRLYRRPGAKTPEAGLSSRERIEAVRDRAQTTQGAASIGRQGLDRCMSDAEELTRRLAATLDNKAARIEVLISDAEDAIGRLEDANQRASGGAGPRGLIGAGDGPRLIGRQRMDPGVLDRARLNQLTREQNGGEADPVVAENSGPGTAEDREPGADLTCRVYELADAGNEAAQIARELDQPIGQVELMLNLRRQTG
ncbi:MAG: hypothetical protein ACI89L_000270 [Phycisphaerales bacterium]|jgi:hypothetical protein